MVKCFLINCLHVGKGWFIYTGFGKFLGLRIKFPGIILWKNIKMEDFVFFTDMIHPETGERISINTLETKRLLRQYVSQYNMIKTGGMDGSKTPDRERGRGI